METLKIKSQRSKIIFITIIALAVALSGGSIWYAATHKGAVYSHMHGAQQTIYYCPMHPNYTSDKPGECPICGMDLVPMKMDEKKQDTKQEGHGMITIESDRQQLIGVKKTKIEMKDAKRTIRTVGKVAFDTELAVAQREYIEVKKTGDRGLAEAARERLTLMGMSDEQIRELKQVERNLYSPQKTAWVYPAIYENEFNLVQRGQTVKIELPSGTGMREGRIIAIDPVVDNQTRTARLRIEVPNDDGVLKPNMYVNAIIESGLGQKLLVPKDAVLSSGERNIVFVVHDDTRFMPHEVKLGAELEDDYVVESGINEGDEVVTGANFLVDAESKLKAALSGSGGHVHGE